MQPVRIVQDSALHWSPMPIKDAKQSALNTGPRSGTARVGCRPPEAVPPPGGTACFREAKLLRTDPPDHTGARNLHQRAVGAAHKLAVGAGLAEVPDRAVIGHPGAPVGAHPYIGGPVQAANSADKRLVEGVVVREPGDLQLQRLAGRREVDQLYFMADFMRRFRRVRGGKAEITLQRIEHRSRPHRSPCEGRGYEFDAGE